MTSQEWEDFLYQWIMIKQDKQFKKCILAPYHKQLEEWVHQHPISTAQIHRLLVERYGPVCSIRTLQNYLKKHF